MVALIRHRSLVRTDQTKAFFSSLSIHYNIGAKAYSAQNREEDRASKGKGGYGEKIGEERAEEVGGGDRREEA